MRCSSPAAPWCCPARTWAGPRPPGPARWSTWGRSWRRRPGSRSAGWRWVTPPSCTRPGQAEPIQAALAEAGWSFLPFMLGVDDAGGRRDQLRAALARYTAAMARHHCQDQVIATGKTDGP